MDPNINATPLVACPARPRLAGHHRLRWDDGTEGCVLAGPSGDVRLNRSAAEILVRCSGERTVDDIVEELERAFGVRGIVCEVERFLRDAVRQGWLR